MALPDTPRKRGRPAGTGLAARVRAALLDDDKWDALVTATYKRALDGDNQAAKLFFERKAPPLRATAELVRIETSGTLSRQARDIITAAVEGRIPPDVASELVRAIGSVVSIEEGDDLRHKLNALLFADIA